MIMTNRQFIELWFFLCSCKTVWYGADGTLFQAFYFLRSDYRHFGCSHYCPYDYRADLQIKEKGNLTNSKLTKERDCMKKNKGITLVALVVTIVVLLILAGVSINLVLGNNGIIAKAKEAQRKSAEATQNDLIGMNELAQQLEEQINGSTGSGSGNGGVGGSGTDTKVPAEATA